MTHTKPGYKHTPLGWIPEDWECKAFQSFIETYSGGTPSREIPEYYNGDIPWIKSGELNQGYITEIEERITEKGLKESSAKIVDKGCLLVALYGATAGIPAITSITAAINQAILAIIPNPEIAEKFYLYLWLLNNRQNIIEKYCQGGQPNLNSEIINNILLPLPPLLEQKAIANLLSTWDTAIEKTEELIAKKELRKKALMQRLLTGKHRLPGFNGKWKDFALSDIFARVTRKNTENNKNIVTISAQRGFVKQEDFFNKLVASELVENYFLISKGEFCYNKSYSNGYDWGATKRLKDFDKAVVTTLYICFGLKNSKEYSGDFFEYFFDANLLDKGLMKIAHEGGRAHGLLNVTPSDFFSLRVNLPDFEEQEQIAKIFVKADEEISMEKERLAMLRRQKKGLMQILLTGKKRLKV